MLPKVNSCSGGSFAAGAACETLFFLQANAIAIGTWPQWAPVVGQIRPKAMHRHVARRCNGGAGGVGSSPRLDLI